MKPRRNLQDLVYPRYSASTCSGDKSVDNLRESPKNGAVQAHLPHIAQSLCIGSVLHPPPISCGLTILIFYRYALACLRDRGVPCQLHKLVRPFASYRPCPSYAQGHMARGAPKPPLRLGHPPSLDIERDATGQPFPSRRSANAARISAGRGGQPGTRTSTGIWRSTGPVTA